MDNIRKDNLSLKVLLLTKSPFLLDNSLKLEENDLGFDQFYNNKQLDKINFPLADMLAIPLSFGNIYLGETFSCFVSIINDGNETCRDISIKTYIRTATQQIVVPNATSSQVGELEPSSSIDDIILHEVKELGSHSLICMVTYFIGNTNEKGFINKSFKFQVSKPLDVKTKFHNAGEDNVFMEAQIQNITNGIIFLEKVSLEPTNNYKVEEIEYSKDDKIFQRQFCRKGETLHGNTQCLKPNNTRVYLYKLSPTLTIPLSSSGGSTSSSNSKSTLLAASTSAQVGRLDIVWRSCMGEKGRLQTSTLSKPVNDQYASVYNDIKFTIDNIPSTGSVGKILQIKCRLENVSERNLDLLLNLVNFPRSGILWTGCVKKHLGSLSSKNEYNLDLELIPITPGLQTVTGLKLTDTLMRRDYEQGDIGQILILNA